MASIHKRPDSSFYIAAFTDARGKRLKRSTKSSNKAVAMRMALDWEAAARGKKTVDQMKAVLSDLGRDMGVVFIQTAIVEEYVTRFIERKKKEVRGKSILYYQSKLKRFLEFLGPRSQEDLATITKADISAYRDLEARRVAPKTVNHAIKAIRAMFASAIEDGLLTSNPAASVKPLAETQEKVRRPFTLDEIKAVFEVATGEWKLMILLGLYTGQRIGDLKRLQWVAVNMKDRTMTFATSKTGRTVVVPLANPLYQALAAIEEREGAVMPGMASLQDVSASIQFGRLLHKAGLREDVMERTDTGRDGRRRSKPLSFHCLRHTAVSWLKSAGVSAPVVEDLVGHDSVEVSRSYTRIDDAAKRAALDLLPVVE